MFICENISYSRNQRGNLNKAVFLSRLPISRVISGKFLMIRYIRSHLFSVLLPRLDGLQTTVGIIRLRICRLYLLSLFKRFFKVRKYICITVIISVFVRTYCVQSFSRTVIFLFFVFPKALLISCYVTDIKWYRTYRYSLFCNALVNLFWPYFLGPVQTDLAKIFCHAFYFLVQWALYRRHTVTGHIHILHQHWARNFFSYIENFSVFFNSYRKSCCFLFSFFLPKE